MIGTGGLLAKIASAINPLGGMDTNVQDQTTPPIDLYFIQGAGVPTTLAGAAVINTKTITVASAAGFTAGTYIGIFSPENQRFYFGTQIGAPSGTTITLDTPLDFAFPAGANVINTTRELKVNGSITPQTFVVAGPGSGSLKVDITRIIIQMTTTDPPSFAEFGDLAALTNGVVLRRNNGIVNNIFNAKTNADLANLMYDLSVISEAKAFNVNGIVGRMTFGGQSKHGVVIRLAAGDFLELIIQDDLTGLLSFRIMAQGHVVD